MVQKTEKTGHKYVQAVFYNKIYLHEFLITNLPIVKNGLLSNPKWRKQNYAHSNEVLGKTFVSGGF